MLTVSGLGFKLFCFRTTMAAVKKQSTNLMMRLRAHTRQFIEDRGVRLKQDIDLLFSALGRSTHNEIPTIPQAEMEVAYNGIMVAVENATKDLIEDQLAQYRSLSKEVKAEIAALNEKWTTPRLESEEEEEDLSEESTVKTELGLTDSDEDDKESLLSHSVCCGVVKPEEPPLKRLRSETPGSYKEWLEEQK